MFTTPPTRNQTIFTSSDVNTGDDFVYHIRMTVDDMAYIGLFNSQNTIIAFYGKATYGQTGDFDGEFQIPTGFSYAKNGLLMTQMDEFTLSKVIDGTEAPIYRNSVRYDIEQSLTDAQKAKQQEQILERLPIGGDINFEEPFFTDVPMLYVTGTCR